MKKGYSWLVSKWGNPRLEPGFGKLDEWKEEYWWYKYLYCAFLIDLFIINTLYVFTHIEILGIINTVFMIPFIGAFLWFNRKNWWLWSLFIITPIIELPILYILGVK